MSQPPPKKNDNPAIWPLVIDDMQARSRLGIERYGTPLQAGNGRDALRDAYEEALDLSVYLRQAIEERDAGGLSAEVERLRAENENLRAAVTHSRQDQSIAIDELNRARAERDDARKLLHGIVGAWFGSPPSSGDCERLDQAIIKANAYLARIINAGLTAAVGGPVPPGAVDLDASRGFIVPAPDSLATKVLRAVEWRGRTLGEPACPLCSSHRGDGHRSGCELAALVRATEAP